MNGLKERTLASLAHLSLPLGNLSIGIYFLWEKFEYGLRAKLSETIMEVLFFPGFLISPFFCLILWLIYRKNNSWISNHAFEAGIYQVFCAFLYLPMYIIRVITSKHIPPDLFINRLQKNSLFLKNDARN